MGRTFEYTISGDPGEYIERAKRAAADAGASFTGDAADGNFSGRGVEGRYHVEGESVAVTIDKKPRMAPWGVIESLLSKFFS